ncbi:MAG: DsbA family protein [Bacteroidota bacterium]
MKTVRIEFISDFICPWCYIGKARLERVEKMLAEEIHLQIEAQPFQLYAFIPKGGLPKSDFAKRTKYGMGRSLRQAAEIEGIELNYRHIERIPNSRDAHRLVSLIEAFIPQYQTAKQIFHDYIEQGQNIEDIDYLLTLGRIAGLPDETLDDFTKAEAGKSLLAQTLAHWQAEFVSVVPSLRLDGKFMVPGLQDADTWVNYIRRAAELQA